MRGGRAHREFLRAEADRPERRGGGRMPERMLPDALFGRRSCMVMRIK